MHTGIYATMMVSAAENLPMGILQVEPAQNLTCKVLVSTVNLHAGRVHPSRDQAPGQRAGHLVDDFAVDIMVSAGNGPRQGSTH